MFYFNVVWGFNNWQFDDDLFRLWMSESRENSDVDMSKRFLNLRSFQVMGFIDIFIATQLLFLQFNNQLLYLKHNLREQYQKQQAMYTLYHHYLHQIKQQQVQRYNQKHRAYLIRSGKLQSNPTYAYSNKQYSSNQNRNVVNNAQKSPSPTISKDNVDEERNQKIEARPKRQRQFNRPNLNRQTDVNEARLGQQRKLQIIPNSRQTKGEQVEIQMARQIQNRKPNLNNRMEQDRPIKQNKLTQQQLEYLNQTNNRGPAVKQQQPPQPIKSQPQRQRPIQPPAQLSEQPQIEDIQLIQCSICGRKFNQKAIQKHENVCQKVFQQKRKPFQVKVIDQEAEKIKKMAKKNDKGKAEVSKKDSEDQNKDAKWKKQSQIFRNMLKKGRGEVVQNEVVEEDDRIQCPGCGRKFCQKAATKHIQHCTKKPKKPSKD